MQLRSYQAKAIEAIKGEFEAGVKATMLVLPTGAGKTVCFSTLAAEARQSTGKPVLVLAHRTELLEQAERSLTSFGLRVRTEKAEETAAGRYADAVVASVQTLTRPARLERFAPDHFGLLITDECHHSTARTYRNIYDYFSHTPHLGVTATPSRHDEVGLRNVYQSCAFQYTIQEAIRDGFLCPIRGTQVEVQGLHLEDLKVVAGEFSQPQLDEMLRSEETLQGMVLPTLHHAEKRPTIVFTPGVEHAHEIAACFNRVRPGSAVAVDGGMSPEDRRRNLSMYEKGRAQFLINVGICTEGYDHPPTACIALFRPTRSLGMLAQMIGRGSRLFEGKGDCLILDFVGVGNTVRTMTLMDVLDGTVLKDEEHKKAQEFQAQGLDAIDALAKAKVFVAGLDSIKAKMRALSTSNAFDVLAMFSVPSCKGLYGGDKATDKQLGYLERVGIKTTGDLEKGEASRLIDQMVKRSQANLATWKQIRYLKRLGYQDNYIEQITFEEASRKIGELVKARSIQYART